MGYTLNYHPQLRHTLHDDRKRGPHNAQPPRRCTGSTTICTTVLHSKLNYRNVSIYHHGRQLVLQQMDVCSRVSVLTIFGNKSAHAVMEGGATNDSSSRKAGNGQYPTRSSRRSFLFPFPPTATWMTLEFEYSMRHRNRVSCVCLPLFARSPFEPLPQLCRTPRSFAVPAPKWQIISGTICLASMAVATRIVIGEKLAGTVRRGQACWGVQHARDAHTVIVPYALRMIPSPKPRQGYSIAYVLLS